MPESQQGDYNSPFTRPPIQNLVGYNRPPRGRYEDPGFRSPPPGPIKSFGLYKPQGFEISGPPARPNFGPRKPFNFGPGPGQGGLDSNHIEDDYGPPQGIGPRGPPPGRGRPQMPEHELEHFGKIEDYLPIPLGEGNSAPPPNRPPNFFRGPPGPQGPYPDPSEGIYHPPQRGNEQHDTYFNQNELPPTPSDFGPTGDDGPDLDNYPQQGPYRENGPGPSGPPQEESRPGPSGPPPGPSGPSGERSRPGPSGPPSGPSGPSGPRPGPSGPPPGPSGPPPGPYGPSGPRGDGRAPPINYRNLPDDDPRKWNDDDFFFDHDFKPYREGRQALIPLNQNGGGAFFDDFTDFYKSSSERTFSAQHPDSYQQGKSFGASDGFPNFFEGI